MPADLLLPLFTLTLLANAVLVAFAIRGMRGTSSRSDGAGWPGRPTASGGVGRAGPDAASPGPDAASPGPDAASPGGRTTGPADVEAHGGASAPGLLPAVALPAEPARAVAATTDADADAIAGRAAARTPDAQATASTDLPRRADEPPAAPLDPGSEVAARSHGPAPAARRQPRATPRGRRPAGPPIGGAEETIPGAVEAEADGAETAANPAAPPVPGPAKRRSRRRFSLPPLDEDHEKVNRSIKSFLAGADATDPAAGGPVAQPEGATTIALVALDRAADGERAARPGEAESPAPEGDPADDISATVERTLRAAARGSDVVTVVGRGRFRITLRATGELAARAYLRRVRATVEPLLDSANHPLRLTIATATALDEPLEDAIDRAERRLAAALASPPADDPAPLGGTAPDEGRPERTPRAAAD